MSSTDQPEYDGWSTRDLADRIDRGDPEAACEVIREMARRLAGQADKVRDPRTVTLDLGRALADISDALAPVLTDITDGVDEPDRSRALEVPHHLHAAGSMLSEIANGWI